MQGLEELCQLPHVASISPTLLHCDLINRHVHVEDGKISGVFDWGCRRWGDHLYDLAWFTFWDPWMKKLDASVLVGELAARWGSPPDPDRFAACLPQIGADHLVCNAAKGDLAGGRALMDRLKTLELL